MSGARDTRTAAARARRAPARSPVALRSALLHRFMVGSFRRFFVRHMNALRLARWGEPVLAAGAGPIVVYSNHPSWWDGAVYLLAADALMPGFEPYAPIDAEVVARHGFFARMGGFSVALDTPRGAADFLAASAEILAAKNRTLWITAQGRFADVRARPIAVKAGIGRLPELAPGCLVLPLAIDYSFWLERGAEACIAFGPPMHAADLVALPRRERLRRLEAALSTLLDRLARDVESREPERFRILVSGRPGIGGVYDGWRRLAAALGGRRFDPSHEGGEGRAA